MGRSSRSDRLIPVFRGVAPWLRRWPWGVGIGVTLVVAGLVAGGAIKQLLGVHSSDCAAGYGAGESSATKLYCAQQLADKRTVDDLQEAIRMANSIPADDPLQSSRDRRLQEWSQELLRLGENLYQEGKLEDAIAAVRRIPPDANLQVQRHIEEWQATWKKAEALYERTLQAIDDREWGKGITTARQILGLGNAHWQTVKYPELMAQLDAARGDQEDSTAQRKRSSSPDLLANWKLRRLSQGNESLSKSQTLAKSRRAPTPTPFPSDPFPDLPPELTAPLPAMPPLPSPAPPILGIGQEPIPVLRDTQPVDSLPQEFQPTPEKSPTPQSSPQPSATPTGQ